ncbi:Man1/Src1 C-terminal protein [Dioscorea alata]|uniref:Man1/Src1 C-terminal protein n=1 Tax=Dioscorea alata TaxID=55571 RepID=A0ACB7UFT3_DIOAL|nr:Man1/Src1 C-terminal protein [Dioscorea alata]
MSATTAKKRSKSRRRDRSLMGWVFSEPSSSLFPSREELVKLLLVVAIAACVAVACHFAAGVLNRRQKPFCENNESFFDLDPEFCEPCPDNGRCSNGDLECFHGYKKHGRVCIEDRSINQTAKELAKGLEDHVCDSYAQILCGKAGKIWVPESGILNALDENKSDKYIHLEDNVFEFAKRKALENIENSLETRTVISGNKEFKCPDMSAEMHKPLLCRARQWMYKHLLHILAVAVMLIGLIRVSWRIKKRQTLLARAEELYEQVCEILEQNAVMAKNAKGGDEKWAVASWLRDHLLLPRERKDAKLWKEVEKLILEDSRISQYPKLIKGESKIVLEWQVEGSLGPKVRRKEASMNTEIKRHHSISSTYKQRQVKECGSLYT